MGIQCDSQEPESSGVCFCCLAMLVKWLIKGLIVLFLAWLSMFLFVKCVECCADKGPWIIVASSDATIEGARYEYNKARKNQLPSMIYLRKKRYRTTIGFFATQQEAAAELPRVKKVMRSNAYMVNLINWCPLMTTRQDRVIKCQ
jgi:hypothetical protein